MIDSINFAKSITDEITAVYIDIDPGPDELEIISKWNEWFPDVKLEIIPSNYRSLVEPSTELFGKNRS